MTAIRAIEFVGGPYCGSVAKVDAVAKYLRIPDRIAGCDVEYVYRATKRTSVKGAMLMEYEGRQEVKVVRDG